MPRIPEQASYAQEVRPFEEPLHSDGGGIPELHPLPLFPFPPELHAFYQKEQAKESTPHPWLVTREGYSPAHQRASEVINSLANGYMGFRASVDGATNRMIAQGEGKSPRLIHRPAFYIAGLFEQKPQSPDEGKTEPSTVPDLLNIQNPLPMRLHNGTEWLDPDTAQFLDYKTTLNLQDGTAVRSFRWQDSEGNITRVEVSRFLSLDNRHVGAVRYAVTPENYSGEITLQSAIDGRVDNKDEKYLEEEDKGNIEGGGIYYVSKSKYKQHTIAVASHLSVRSADSVLEVTPQVTSQDEHIAETLQVPVMPGETYTFDKTYSVYSSRDTDATDPLYASKDALRTSSSVDSLRAKTQEAWAKKWAEADIKISGDEFSQHALRYNLFKLMQLAWEGDEHVSIAAKGLDNAPGEGYLGHVFWDTEIFMLPAFNHTQPEIARSLLMYRYHTLDAARQKAKDHGYKGALYPWESADSGAEATPRWVHDEDKKLVDIYTGEREYHISGDVAHAVWEYYKTTGDEEFLRNYGGEMIAETARFWASKVEWDETKEKYVIRNVIGPDEYHEKDPRDHEVGVDNNIWNNVLAARNIDLALDIFSRFAKNDPQMSEKMGITPEESDRWQHISEHMYIPYDPQTKLFEQFEGYHNLKHVDLDSEYPGVTAMDAQLRKEGKEPYLYDVIKQADVVLTLDKFHEYIFEKLGITDPAEQQDILRTNYYYYEQRCSHGSSLSDGSHVTMGIKSGDSKHAMDHFKHATTIDLLDTKLNNHFGSHAASLGQAWKGTVYGWGGIEVGEHALIIDPRLPQTWDGATFSVRYLGQKVGVTIDNATGSLQLDLAKESPRESVPVQIGGRTYTLHAGETYAFPLTKTEQQRLIPVFDSRMVQQPQVAD